MLTPGGAGCSGAVSAKLLDFGLAKLVAQRGPPSLGGEAAVATQSAPVTADGAIVGTLQYMAPEHREGTEPDARTDLWALGAILYEMLAGQFSFSPTGMLAWVHSPVVPYPTAWLVTVDHQGSVTRLAAPSVPYVAILRVSPDGRRLAATDQSHTEGRVWIYDLDRGTLVPANRAPEFSRDGRWLAYTPDISGREEVYVRPFPGSGKPTQVSVDGGVVPAWNPRGGELFFLGDSSRPASPARRRAVMAVDIVLATPAPRIGRPKELFQYDVVDLAFCGSPVRCHDVAPDGDRFHAVQGAQPSHAKVTHIDVIPNWFEELKA